ncbi:hypothetical protein CBFG_02122 [Clostridiales bacterium 1_7_47FAA]|nr:hypothetical protein CBFG_02122 [Clostridiales bacterium 1_7_47FAA]
MGKGWTEACGWIGEGRTETCGRMERNGLKPADRWKGTDLTRSIGKRYCLVT